MQDARARIQMRRVSRWCRLHYRATGAWPSLNEVARHTKTSEGVEYRRPKAKAAINSAAAELGVPLPYPGVA